MSDVTRTTLSNEADREATAEELANVPSLTPQEMTEVMKSPEYRNSKLVQQLVAASIAKSDHSAPVTEEPQAAPDDIAARQAYFSRLFRDPRYKSDAAYRYEVQQQVKAMTENDNFDSNTGNALSMSDLKTPGQVMRVSVSSAQGHGVDLSVRKFQRVQVGPDVSSLEMGMQRPKAKREYFPDVQE
jgi:hypothetical protein